MLFRCQLSVNVSSGHSQTRHSVGSARVRAWKGSGFRPRAEMVSSDWLESGRTRCPTRRGRDQGDGCQAAGSRDLEGGRPPRIAQERRSEPPALRAGGKAYRIASRRPHWLRSRSSLRGSQGGKRPSRMLGDRGRSRRSRGGTRSIELIGGADAGLHRPEEVEDRRSGAAAPEAGTAEEPEGLGKGSRGLQEARAIWGLDVPSPRRQESRARGLRIEACGRFSEEFASFNSSRLS